MKLSLRNFMIPALATVMTLTVACTRESSQNQPVKTTTEQGSSTAPASHDAANRDKALVRVVHAMPAQPPVDAFAGDSRTFSNVTYKTVTPYAELTDDRQRLTLKPAGQPGALRRTAKILPAASTTLWLPCPLRTKTPSQSLECWPTTLRHRLQAKQEFA